MKGDKNANIGVVWMGLPRSSAT